MARACYFCEKKRLVGFNISHAHNKTKKRSYPNLQRVHAVISGTARRVVACTRCIRSGTVQKAA